MTRFALTLLLLSGCISEHTGSTTIVGEEIAWPEISNSSESVKVRVFQSIKGAKVWTAKDCKVKIKYHNAYTNSYFGVLALRDYMKLDVEIEPLQVEMPEKATD